MFMIGLDSELVKALDRLFEESQSGTVLLLQVYVLNDMEPVFNYHVESTWFIQMANFHCI